MLACCHLHYGLFFMLVCCHLQATTHLLSKVQCFEQQHWKTFRWNLGWPPMLTALCGTGSVRFLGFLSNWWTGGLQPWVQDNIWVPDEFTQVCGSEPRTLLSTQKRFHSSSRGTWGPPIFWKSSTAENGTKGFFTQGVEVHRRAHAACCVQKQFPQNACFCLAWPPVCGIRHFLTNYWIRGWDASQPQSAADYCKRQCQLHWPLTCELQLCPKWSCVMFTTIRLRYAG